MRVFRKMPPRSRSVPETGDTAETGLRTYCLRRVSFVGLSAASTALECLLRISCVVSAAWTSAQSLLGWVSAQSLLLAGTLRDARELASGYFLRGVYRRTSNFYQRYCQIDIIQVLVR